MIIYVDSSTHEACIVVEGQEPIIIPYSNQVTVNVGEYRALLLALWGVERAGWKQPELFTDSLLVAQQVKGKWKCRQTHLLPLLNEARSLVKELKATVNWLPREENLAGKVLE